MTEKTNTQSKLLRRPRAKAKSSERFHSLQLWWTVAVAIALGITYLVDANRAERYPKSAKSGPLFERLPAEADRVDR